MTGHEYSPELIAWVRRTTRARGLPEKIDADTFALRVGALFDIPNPAQRDGKPAARNT